jgi:NAD(P)-dependent dehydrogenase (short-subunit alcohol dehydrogenase family)
LKEHGSTRESISGNVRAIDIFTGAVAVVTGAGSGIGRALVVALAKRKAQTVIALDLNGETVEQTAMIASQETDTTVIAKILDVTDEHAVRSCVEQVEREFGAIDLWFSNAGVNRGDGIGNTLDWNISLDVNLLAHVYSARSVLPGMERRGVGRFVLTASAAGLLSDIRNAPYTVSKHALVGFAEWLAIGVGEGVKVSCVCPEGVLTGMTKADSKSAGPGINFIEADEVAECALNGAGEGQFLILTHPRTAEYEARRVQDRQSWISSMRKARMRNSESSSLFAA